MGLFEKTEVCEHCGEEFTTGKFSKDKLCPMCSLKSAQAQLYCSGFPKTMAVQKSDYMKVAEYRDSLLEKYRKADADIVSDDEILQACANVKTMSMDEKKRFIYKLYKSCINDQGGAAITENLIISNDSGMVMELKDVFAVAYERNIRVKADAGVEPINCLLKISLA